MTDVKTAKTVLKEFLFMPLDKSEPVLEKFAALEGAVSQIRKGKRSFVYVPGTRSDRVVLAAHADTVWDRGYFNDRYACRPRERFGVFRSPRRSECGIGADDRAGCAILWLLRDLGHSLLVLDGEEHGQTGARSIKALDSEIFEEINGHSYIIQFDRRGASDYKCYDLPVTEEFRRFIESSTGYADAGKTAKTDIVALCETVCGVNLSVGYYDEHTKKEKLVFNEWYNTLITAEKMLKPGQTRFPLGEKEEEQEEKTEEKEEKK